MKRFAAITTSVVMIAIAVIIRSNIDSKGSSSGVGSTSGPVTIACVTELEQQCRALKNVTVRVEDAATTAKAIAAGTAHIDGWVTFEPWPEMANQLARRTVTGGSARLASSPLVIAMVAERATAFAPTCGGSVNWHCLGDAIGRQWTEVGGRPEWGTVKAGVPPVSSGAGLLLLGNAASGYFGRTDFATNDFDAEFGVWRSNVVATPATFATFLLQFPAAFSAVGTIAAQADAGARTSEVVFVGPPPTASAVVVLAQVDSNRAQGRAGDLTKALRDARWDTAPPASSGLPDAGVLLALSGLTG